MGKFILFTTQKKEEITIFTKQINSYFYTKHSEPRE